jgi:hypothetical protein
MAEKIGFWEALFTDGISWREREAINLLDDAVAFQQEDMNFRLGKITEVIRDQKLAISQLRVTVNVLVQLLHESGGLNREELHARIDAAMKALEAPPAPAGPYRDGGAAGQAAAPRAVPDKSCCRCLKWFAENRLNITEDGLMCDRCLAHVP